MTFAKTFKRCFNHNMWVVVALLAIVAYGAMTQQNEGVNRPTAVGSLVDVMEKNVCENTVKGEFPTGAIVRKVGGGHSFTTNPKMIGKGLDEEFANVEWAAFDVIHFCK